MKHKETIKTVVITVLITSIIAFVAGAYYEYGAYTGLMNTIHQSK